MLHIMKEHKAFRLMQLFLAIVSTLGALLASFVALLAESAKTSDSNEASDNAARGGLLNFRTGKFDDGTDPGGWYEKD